MHKHLDQGEDLLEIANKLLDNCVADDPRESRGLGCDNMTCCILSFKKSRKPA